MNKYNIAEIEMSVRNFNISIFSVRTAFVAHFDSQRLLFNLAMCTKT